MYHIHCLNKISPKGTALLTDNYAIDGRPESGRRRSGALRRHARMWRLPESLLAIARAGAGVNNIPLSTTAPKRALWCSTPPAPTPTP